MTETSPRLPIGEAAKLLGVHCETLRRWERQGIIASVRTPGGQRRFARADVDALMTKNEEAAS